MPIHEYLCDDCRTHHERLVFSENDRITCPHCGSEHNTLQPSVFCAPRSNSSPSGDFSASSCGCTPKTCGCR